jgi:hypothetical protein
MGTCRGAALAAIVAWSYLSQPGREAVMAIVDTDASPAESDLSLSLRTQVLTHVEGLAPVTYFALTARAIDEVAASARTDFLRSRAPDRPQPNGIALTFDEAAQILRKNEAVRDAVIVRTCSASPAPGCGSAVHVAAATLVDAVESASRQKVQRLVERASTRSADIVLLITPGWPYRDEQPLRLPAAIAALRGTAARMVIVRLPSRVGYGRLVKDATETMAHGLSAPFIALENDTDLPRAQQLLSAQIPATATTAGAAAPAVVPDSPRTPLAATPLPPSPPDPYARVDDVLQRATDYADRFERTFSAVIWREQYRQEVRIRRRFGASGTSFTSVAARRLLDSELLFVWLPDDASWIAVRDVLAVDGHPRRGVDRPLLQALKKDAVTVDQLKQLAAENGRFNIGTIVRTFNEPTLALLFLDPQYRHRFAFTRHGEQPVHGESAVTYEFVERQRPTVIREGDHDLPVRGTLWIAPATGRVLQTSLELADRDRRLEGRMTVQYIPHPKFDVLVPSEMRERYTSESGEEVSTVATYSDFRRFEATVRLK